MSSASQLLWNTISLPDDPGDTDNSGNIIDDKSSGMDLDDELGCQSEDGFPDDSDAASDTTERPIPFLDSPSPLEEDTNETPQERNIWEEMQHNERLEHITTQFNVINQPFWDVHGDEADVEMQMIIEQSVRENLDVLAEISARGKEAPPRYEVAKYLPKWFGPAPVPPPVRPVHPQPKPGSISYDEFSPSFINEAMGFGRADLFLQGLQDSGTPRQCSRAGPSSNPHHTFDCQDDWETEKPYVPLPLRLATGPNQFIAQQTLAETAKQAALPDPAHGVMRYPAMSDLPFRLNGDLGPSPPPGLSAATEVPTTHVHPDTSSPQPIARQPSSPQRRIITNLSPSEGEWTWHDADADPSTTVELDDPPAYSDLSENEWDHLSQDESSVADDDIITVPDSPPPYSSNREAEDPDDFFVLEMDGISP